MVMVLALGAAGVMFCYESTTPNTYIYQSLIFGIELVAIVTAKQPW